MLAGALRAAMLPGRHLEFMRLETFDKHVASRDDADLLFRSATAMTWRSA